MVQLSSWQLPGINLQQSNTSTNRPQLIMSEFNSASCGGVPAISDTFAVGSLWTVDYALQMASVGYSAAYLHTRERGITYNLFAPPEGPDGAAGAWVTGPPYYALVAAAEALHTPDGNGNIVVDLNINNSTKDKGVNVAGYGIYDSKGTTLQQFALFNYANVSTSGAVTTATFNLPASAFASSSGKNNVTVKYLSAQDAAEKINIAWGGQTLAGVGNGSFKDVTSSWAAPNKILDCTNGCTVEVPATALAVVFAGGANQVVTVKKPANTTNSTNNSALHSTPLFMSLSNSFVFILGGLIVSSILA